MERKTVAIYIRLHWLVQGGGGGEIAPAFKFHRFCNQLSFFFVSDNLQSFSVNFFQKFSEKYTSREFAQTLVVGTLRQVALDVTNK
ncbi:Protein CBG26440 [Caenorhabditis briggsae]|uniref:Protein CBG26440 n=1 Tax=Caenorhabditis briggsae TaxID=6238 RepID=B6IEX7_CAEBR|nr:Protein CBG26440 [Caenorhabditis briggsae]CAR98457.1 Protein CBG26440 [Caenorhabditis briggsae]